MSGRPLWLTFLKIQGRRTSRTEAGPGFGTNKSLAEVKDITFLEADQRLKNISGGKMTWHASVL